MSTDILGARKDHSEKRLGELSAKIAALSHVVRREDLCIYVTGSYGRLEASEYSDLDLFFVHKGKKEDAAIPRLAKTRIDAQLIDLAEQLGFAPFSNDGEYLEVHYLDDICQTLGGPADDHENRFTARMLLLLESRAVFNNAMYEESLNTIINSYYRDYHDHEKSFRPVFLINDILRFWKTLCLNYEHKRNLAREEQKNKNHLRNLKLKFSRLLTCFSVVISLVKNPNVVPPKQLAAMIHMSPMQRLEQAAQDVSEGVTILTKIAENYSWFLEATGKEENEVLSWISRREVRDEAFSKGREFGDALFSLLLKVCSSHEHEVLRYLVM
jgi:predicted nucleotidyltransferase